jgi:uncharacterized membrane protein YdbT with pleckstrin-like domain
MIMLNDELRLGRKAYLMMAVKSLLPPLIIFGIAIVLMIAATGIADLIFVFMKIAGPVSAATARSIYMGVNYVVLLAFLLGTVSLVMSFLTSHVNYRNYTFTFEEFGMRLKRGLWKTIEVTIPYRQMQSVEIERRMLHHLTGTSGLIINSAGYEDPGTDQETDIVLDPIDMHLAEDVRVMLQRKIGVQVVEGEREADRQALEESAPVPPPAESPSRDVR